MIWGRGRWQGRPSKSGGFPRWISCAAPPARVGCCDPKPSGRLTPCTVFSDPTSCPLRVCAVLSSAYRGLRDTNVGRTLSCLDSSGGVGLVNRVAQEKKKYSSLPSIGPPLPHLHLQSPRTPDGEVRPVEIGGKSHTRAGLSSGTLLVGRNRLGRRKPGFEVGLPDKMQTKTCLGHVYPKTLFIVYLKF